MDELRWVLEIIPDKSYEEIEVCDSRHGAGWMKLIMGSLSRARLARPLRRDLTADSCWLHEHVIVPQSPAVSSRLQPPPTIHQSLEPTKLWKHLTAATQRGEKENVIPVCLITSNPLLCRTFTFRRSLKLANIRSFALFIEFLFHLAAVWK